MNRTSLVSFVLLSALLLSAANTPESCNTSNQSLSVGPSTGEVVGAAVAVVAVIAVGTVVLVEVHKSHHTIKGCVTAGPSGLQVIDTANAHTYNVTGVTANVKVGDIVRLHGDKQKKVKGDPAQDFVIQKINKDYGPCKITPAQLSSASPAP
jgi:hypothetical protein